MTHEEVRAAAERLSHRKLEDYQGPTGDDTDMRAAIALARFVLDLTDQLAAARADADARVAICESELTALHQSVAFALAQLRHASTIGSLNDHDRGLVSSAITELEKHASGKARGPTLDVDKVWREAVEAVLSEPGSPSKGIVVDFIYAEVERRMAAKPDVDNRVTALAKERDREWQEAVDYI